MSQLNRQLQELLPELKSEAKELKDSVSKKRWRDLRFILRSKDTVIGACRILKVSDDYFRKWAKKVLVLRSLKALESGSCRPHTCPNKMSQSTECRVIELRKSEPFLGPDRIKSQYHHQAGGLCDYQAILSVLNYHTIMSVRMRHYEIDFPVY